jgi:putative oxidoreductase
LQRLFSTFPTGRPGVGLLLLRFAVGVSLVLERIPAIWVIPQSLDFEVRIVLICLGVSLLCGLWTPVMGSVAAVFELLVAFSQSGCSTTHVLLAILSIGLTLLGPGAWSIDAHIFGRKRIDIKLV